MILKLLKLARIITFNLAPLFFFLIIPNILENFPFSFKFLSKF